MEQTSEENQRLVNRNTMNTIKSLIGYGKDGILLEFLKYICEKNLKISLNIPVDINVKKVPLSKAFLFQHFGSKGNLAISFFNNFIEEKETPKEFIGTLKNDILLEILYTYSKSEISGFELIQIIDSVVHYPIAELKLCSSEFKLLLKVLIFNEMPKFKEVLKIYLQENKEEFLSLDLEMQIFDFTNYLL